MHSRTSQLPRSHRARALFVLITALLISLFSASQAAAQDEVDGVKPLVMIIMDTSGSMEFVTQDDEYPCCVSPSDSIIVNGPNRCGAFYGPGGQLLTDPDTTPAERSTTAQNLLDNGFNFRGNVGIEADNMPRHVIAKEVMTGRLENYACIESVRNPLNAGEGDVFGLDGNIVRDDSGTALRFDLDDNHPVPHYEASATDRINSTGIVFLNRDLVRFGAMILDSDPWGGDRWGLRWENDEGASETSQTPCSLLAADQRAAVCSTNDLGATDIVSAFINRDWREERYYRNGWNLGARMWYDDAADGAGRNVYAGSVPFGDLNDPNGGRLAAAQVEKSLSQFIPYSGTPLAAAFKDLKHYFRGTLADTQSTHNEEIQDDVFKDCRQKHVIVITDGDPSYDYCHDIGNLGNLSLEDQDMCQSYRNIYKPTISELEDLVTDPALDNVTVHIVGFRPPGSSAPCVGANTINGTGATDDCIDQLAFVGRSDSNNNDTDNIYAYRATNQEELSREITRILNSIVASVSSRTKIATTTRTRNRLSRPELYQFGSAFELDPDSHLWRGILERQTFTCQGNVENVVTEDFSDYFDANPSMLANRNIISSFQDPDVNDEIDYKRADGKKLIRLEGSATGMASRLGGLNNRDVNTIFAGGTINGLTYDNGPRDADGNLVSNNSISDLIYGTHPFRQGRALGDIFHSNPTVVGGPELDVPIRGYERFAKTVNPTNAPRPTMVYVGTNAGLLHAFNAEFDFNRDLNTSSEIDGRSFTNSFESWAFLPEELQDKVYLQQVTRIFGVDASPTVRDLRMFRGPEEFYPTGLVDPAAGGAFDGVGVLPVPDVWATVLVSGLGQGGRAYFALDVSDPTNPRHLWELNEKNEIRRLATTDPVQEPFQNFAKDTSYPSTEIAAIAGPIPMIGLTYGQAGMGTVSLRTPTDDRLEKAVAVVPGGVNPFPEITDPNDPKFYLGKAIYIIDQATGGILRRFTHVRQRNGDEVPIKYPVTGSVASYHDFPGTFLTRSFVGDAGGRLLRIDTRATNPADWYVEVFDDAYCNDREFVNECGDLVPEGDDARRPIYIKPSIAPSTDGELVVVYGTGDIDDLPRRNQRNRVISVREELELSEAGVILAVNSKRNWLYDFKDQNGTNGEKMTGSPLIFADTVYFPTFVPDQGDVCQFGNGRVYAMNFLGTKCESGGRCDTPENFVSGFAEEDGEDQDDVAVNENRLFFDVIDSGVIFGLDLTRRPNCADIPDNIGNDPDANAQQLMQSQDNLELVIQTGANSHVGGGAPGALAQSRIKKVRFKVNAPPSRIFPTSWSVILD